MVLLAAQVWRPVNQKHQGRELAVKLRDRQNRKLSFLLLDGAHLDRWGSSLYMCIYLCICMSVCMCMHVFVPVSETQQSASSWLRAHSNGSSFLRGLLGDRTLVLILTQQARSHLSHLSSPVRACLCSGSQFKPQVFLKTSWARLNRQHLANCMETL